MKPAEIKPAEDIRRADSELDKGSDLPELAVRMLSDFGRIVAAEARLLEINIIGAAQALVERVYIAALLIVVGASGLVAIIASIALLLHQWLPWWQVLGILGLALILLAEVLRRTLTRPDVPTVETSRDNSPGRS